MIDKSYVFPYDLGDAAGYGATWNGDILSMTFCRYYKDDTDPNEIEIKFHGVTWMRTTSLIKYPCPDEEWDVYSFDANKSIEEYLLVERDWFNNDYEEFMSGNGFGLNTIRCLADNIVFIDDRLIFSCTEIEIVRAECNPDIGNTVRKLLAKDRD